MDDLEPVVEQAKRLAASLAEHPRWKAYQDAVAAVQEDPSAVRLQREYAQAVDEVRGREMAGRPVEPEQKRALVALSEQVRASAPLMALIRASDAYTEMLSLVQSILTGAEIGAEREVEGAQGEEPPEEEPPRSSVLWTP